MTQGAFDIATLADPGQASATTRVVRRLKRLASGLPVTLCLMAVGVVHARAQSISGEAVREAVEDELSSWNYQRTLTTAEPDVPDIDFDLPPGLAEVLGWIAIAIVAIVALVWLWRLLADRRASAVVEEPEAETAPALKRAAPSDLLAEADRLAAEGRYSEAVHVLLVGTFGGFAEAGARFVAPPLTSREVLADAPLRDSVKAALGELVSVVERAHFAGRTIGRGEFERCRESYRSIAGEIADGAHA